MSKMNGLENSFETALAWLDAGKDVTIATVVETWGSAPRPVGAQLVIDGEGHFEGSVSGGCVESAVVMAALESRTPQLLDYGVSDEEVFAVGLACGGNIKIMVMPVGESGLTPEVLRKIVAARAARVPMVLKTDLTSFESVLIEDRNALSEAEQALVIADKSQSNDGVFCHVLNPPLRLYIIGAVHIAQALVPMAALANYDITIIDPRGSFLTRARFPEGELCEAYPEDALEGVELDARSALVTLTHDPKIDEPALEVAFAGAPFYIGSLGSNRTHQKRVERLKAKGFSDVELAKIHAPIGLNIGAKSPSEIAISIIAEITERLRKPDTR